MPLLHGEVIFCIAFMVFPIIQLIYRIMQLLLMADRLRKWLAISDDLISRKMRFKDIWACLFLHHCSDEKWPYSIVDRGKVRVPSRALASGSALLYSTLALLWFALVCDSF